MEQAMKTTQAGPRDIDEYISGYPKDVQAILQKIRSTVHAAAPGAEERISYGMAAFRLNGNLVYFAGFKNHIGFYPIPTGVERFKKDLALYKTAKGSVQFQLAEPIPYALITKIVKFRVKENLARSTKKRNRFRA
jgi:uncharacterized protein YdhG (YjbR/CyaY superfamily)